MDLQLAGKNVLVTGAGQGIGREIGVAFAAEGANVGFHFHSSGEGAEAAAADARGAGVKACAIAGDLANIDDVRRIADEYHNLLGTVDVLINNAAYTETKPFLKDSHEGWQRQIDVTVGGMLQMTHVLTPDLQASGGGAVVTMAGDSGRVGESRAVVTSTCRSAAYGFTKAFAKEYARDGVRANCVSLGLIRSPSVERHLLGELSPELVDKVVKAYPLRRLGEMSDVTAAVLLLASPVSGWTTGQVLSINGGYAM